MTSGRPARDLRPRVRALLRHLWRFQRERGYGPTYRELMEVSGLCRATVGYQLQSLVVKGLAAHTPWTARGTTLTAEGILVAQGYHLLFMLSAPEAAVA